MANRARLKYKTNLFLKVTYISSAVCALFAFACYFLLNIKVVIPTTLLIYSLLNIINILLFLKHKRITITYNLTSIFTLISTVIITLFSGGINSPFIFMLGLIVFASYINAKKLGAFYLYLTFLIITLLFLANIFEPSFITNEVPDASKNWFSFISVLFAMYLLGAVFGKLLIKAQSEIYSSKVAFEKKVKEKDTLIKEVHHRVKNNLQTVSSLLSLQARSIKDTEIKTMIKSSQNRVNSMAMVHEMLYMREDLSKIEYKSYVEELSEYLVRSIKGTDNGIKVDIDIIDINLGIDTAIPLGLLINEAITNSLKYGIKENTGGEINISLKKETENDYVLNIGDNGEGYPETITPKNSKSLGLKLIYNLTRQLKGSILKDATKKGTNYIITFKEINQTFHPAQ
ncbi:sensor histidine kinase [Cellulophaga baltica]|uniref:sensor histidine kinase n=1 Tax=Cellulophaga TaxID=104264 RepID=UPI001C07C1E7|nr:MULTISPECIES: sensor histidine kinase [Cellulophaga]MBU2996563.1 sensor histidine kinase [Cellulophaga baltica]MDO6767957.1 sensor histidine kinase [Cellulophaga sp. 1_MG-2023]